VTIVLRAVSIPDASAFVEIDGRLRLIRPPFTLHSTSQLSEDDLNLAIVRANYVPVSKQFVTFHDLIAYVRQIHDDWVNEIGLPLGGTTSADEFISEIGSSMIDDVIERIDKELIPNGLCEQAGTLLLAIIKSQAAEADPKIRTRALASLVKVYAQRGENSAASTEIADRRFETIQDEKTKNKIRNIKVKIRERHCVLELQADT
jgi:hypothetical protein